MVRDRPTFAAYSKTVFQALATKSTKLALEQSWFRPAMSNRILQKKSTDICTGRPPKK